MAAHLVSAKIVEAKDQLGAFITQLKWLKE